MPETFSNNFIISWLLEDLDRLTFLLAVMLGLLAVAKKRWIDTQAVTLTTFMGDALSAAVLVPLFNLLAASWFQHVPVDSVVNSNKVLLSVALLTAILMTLGFMFNPSVGRSKNSSH